MALIDLFENNTDLPINKWVHYFPVYQRHFEPYVGRKQLFIEIGSGNGGSSRLWRRFLGPQTTVVSLDIRPECAAYETEGVHMRIGDQGDPAFLQSVLDEFGQPTIVLDDGSHIQHHMNASINILYPHLLDGGVYMVEDTHTSYWPAWEGGVRKPGTFIEEMKLIIDGLHADNPHNAVQAAEPNIPVPLSLLTTGIHFYPSIVVLEKNPPAPKFERSLPHIEGLQLY